MGALDWNGSPHLDRINFYETVPLSGLDRTVWLDRTAWGTASSHLCRPS